MIRFKYQDRVKQLSSSIPSEEYLWNLFEEIYADGYTDGYEIGEEEGLVHARSVYSGIDYDDS
jgi:flagellar biosynthesis/type III secretory pathway protein FliH